MIDSIAQEDEASRSSSANPSSPTLSALITGASRGIGLAVARALKSLCGDMALVGSSTDSFSEVRQEFEGNVKFYGADFSSSEELIRLAESLAANHQKFDVFVNNCGVYAEGQFAEATLPDIERIIDVNLKSPVMLTRMLLDQIRKGSNSIVINMSSIQAKNPEKNLAVYASSKAALTAFSDALRKELNPLGIRVTVVHPAGVNTWNATDPSGLLRPEDVGELIKSIVTQLPHCQINEVTLSGI